MAKSTKKERNVRAATKPKKQPHTRKLAKAADQKPSRPDTKQATAIELLRAPAGANIEALMTATGWQQHSVRGFLSGVVRKRLKLHLKSVLEEGIRIYRITGGANGKPAKPHAVRTES
jgi:hypothetical protein